MTSHRRIESIAAQYLADKIDADFYVKESEGQIELCLAFEAAGHTFLSREWLRLGSTIGQVRDCCERLMFEMRKLVHETPI